MGATVGRLVELLDVRAAPDGTFVGCPFVSPLPRVFGGLVVGQALAAAGRSVGADRRPHSLHAYFLRAGDGSKPISYEVTELRDGRSFSTREIRARQETTPIFTMTASFHVDESGPDHQVTTPPMPPPHTVPAMSERPDEWPDIYRHWAAVEIRPVARRAESPNDARSWMRMTGALPDDSLLHACVLACISDLSLLAVTLVPHDISQLHEDHQLASLDHAVWFHRPCRVDDWLLYDQTTPSTGNARGFALGRIHTADGTLAATVAQEGLLRPSG